MKKQEDLLKKFYKIIDFDDIMINTVFCLKYNNKNLEEEYSLYLLKSTRKMRIIVNFISLCLVILRFLDSCQGNRFDIDFYFDLFTSICTLVLFIVLHFAVKSFKAVKVLSSIYTIYVCFIYGCSLFARRIMPDCVCIVYIESTPLDCQFFIFDVVMRSSS